MNKHATGITDQRLLFDWDYTKNDVEPLEVSPYSSKYIHWKCHKCGHEWSAKLSNRTSGRGCPACSNKVLVKGKNDLATTHPDLVKEWHPTLNLPLRPDEIMHGTNKKVWWVCPIGHVYQASVLHRSAQNGTGCPICNKGRQTSFNEQALYFYIKKKYPDAINGFRSKFLQNFELDIYIPTWKIAIEYDGEPWHGVDKIEREKRKFKICKDHGIRLIRIKETVLDVPTDEIADDIFTMSDFYDKYQFVQLIHVILSRISFNPYYFKPLNIDLDRDRFEIIKCANNLKNTFASVYPMLAKEWHPSRNNNLLPTMFKPKSDFKAWWKCPKCGNEYEMALSRRANGSGCPICAKTVQVASAIKNRIAKNGSIADKLLLKEWNYERNGELRPEQFTRCSDKNVWWKCSVCNYEWRSKISNRAHGKGCPCCANRVIVQGLNDLATQHPELIAEWDYENNGELKPTNVGSGCNKEVWWICPKCGNKYQAPPSRRTSQNSGCKKCATQIASQTRRHTSLLKNGSLAQNYPELMKEYAPTNTIDPNEITGTYRMKVRWICSTCRHEWETSPYVRTKGCGCPICGQNKAIQSRKKNKK